MRREEKGEGWAGSQKGEDEESEDVRSEPKEIPGHAVEFRGVRGLEGDNV